MTPHDLEALAPFFEECACLSAQAALLAVLVARMGERERIVVRPSDLMEDLRRRLYWRDAPERLHGKVVAAWLKDLGFAPTGRNHRGLQYEIRWQQLWALDPRAISARGALNPRALDGAELARLLVKEPDFFFAPKIWCPRCRGVVMTLGDSTGRQEETWPCDRCGSQTTLLDNTWLTVASDRMRHAIRKGSNLLAALKAEWKELHDAAPFPRLARPLDWFNAVWERAGKPRGRPASVLKRYELAHAIDWLARAHVAKPDIERIFAARGNNRQVLYNDLPDRVRRFLGTGGRGHVVAAPTVDPRTLWASVRWARRQWTNPAVRWRGEGPFPSVARQQGTV